MGLSGPLVVGPLVVMFLIVVITFGSASSVGANGASPFCQPNSNLTCTGTTITNSTGSATGGTTYTCNPVGNACTLPFACPSGTLPPHTYCSAAGLWILNGGYSVFIPSSVQSNLGPAPVNTNGASGGGTNFIFGALTPDGMIAMIVTATTLVIIGAVSFFGTGGLDDETAHIVWITALLMGVWIMLASADGFVFGSPSSFFVQLNSLLAGMGTIAFFFLSMIYTFGVISTVSRSSGASAGV